MSLESGRKNLLESLPEHEVTLRDLLIRDSYFYKDLLRFYEGNEIEDVTNDYLLDWWANTDKKDSKYRIFTLPSFSEEDLLDIQKHLLGELTEDDIPEEPFGVRAKNLIGGTLGLVGISIASFGSGAVSGRPPKD